MVPAVKRRKKKPGDSTRFKVHGLWHEYRMYAGRYRLYVEIGGKWVMCMNEELPRSPGPDAQYIAHPQDGICERCEAALQRHWVTNRHTPAAVVYSHLMRNAGQPCNECQLERAAEKAAELERAGIPLGWGYAGRDENTAHTSFIREVAKQKGWSERDLSELDARYGARRLRQPNG